MPDVFENREKLICAIANDHGTLDRGTLEAIADHWLKTGAAVLRFMPASVPEPRRLVEALFTRWFQLWDLYKNEVIVSTLHQGEIKVLRQLLRQLLRAAGFNPDNLGPDGCPHLMPTQAQMEATLPKGADLGKGEPKQVEPMPRFKVCKYCGEEMHWDSAAGQWGSVNYWCNSQSGFICDPA